MFVVVVVSLQVFFFATLRGLWHFLLWHIMKYNIILASIQFVVQPATGIIGSCVLPITNYPMAPSKRGAGGGSATHKEPT